LKDVVGQNVVDLGQECSWEEGEGMYEEQYLPNDEISNNYIFWKNEFYLDTLQCSK